MHIRLLWGLKVTAQDFCQFEFTVHKDTSVSNYACNVRNAALQVAKSQAKIITTELQMPNSIVFFFGKAFGIHKHEQYIRNLAWFQDCSSCLMSWFCFPGEHQNQSVLFPVKLIENWIWICLFSGLSSFLLVLSSFSILNILMPKLVPSGNLEVSLNWSVLGDFEKIQRQQWFWLLKADSLNYIDFLQSFWQCFNFYLKKGSFLRILTCIDPKVSTDPKARSPECPPFSLGFRPTPITRLRSKAQYFSSKTG